MPPADQTVRTYRELAEDYGRQGQAQMRDRFMVLAADAALAAGQKDEAERLRGRLLQHNPHHLLKPYSSFAEAMTSADVQNYVSALRRNHPYEKAENLLEVLHHSAERRVTASPEIEPGTRKEAQETREDLKVFRAMDGAGEPKAGSSRPAPHARPFSQSTPPPSPPPVVPAQSSQAPPLARPAAAPDIFPIHREPYAALDKLRAARSEDRDPSPATWVSIGLFLVVLVTGIILGAYTLIRPFLPQGWL